VVALERWPLRGVPDSPAAWLLTAARRKGIDRLRRDRRYAEKLALLEQHTVSEPSAFPDERLGLMFACCHPAIPRDAQLALTLRSVAGLTTVEIARAFLVPEATIAQRIVRAKRRIVEDAIPLRVPDAHELPDRVGEVLAVIYLLFNEGYLATSGESAARRDLADEAEWLASLLAKLMPDEPEVLGLVALIRAQLARSEARFDAAGAIVLLQAQDRTRFDRARIADAKAMLERAARMRRPGRYQLQAAIALSHAEAPSWEATDWPEIAGLYDALSRLDPSPVVRLNRAIALSHVAGPAFALEEVDRLAADLDRYPYLHATRAEFLRALGRVDEARAADARALELTSNPAERQLLLSRLAT
jgi:predicted RNA polymerase sigma factor